MEFFFLCKKSIVNKVKLEAKTLKTGFPQPVFLNFECFSQEAEIM